MQHSCPYASNCASPSQIYPHRTDRPEPLTSPDQMVAATATHHLRWHQWTLRAGTVVQCLCLCLHTRQSNCKMGMFSAAHLLPSARLDATVHLPTARRGWRRDPRPATMVISRFLPNETKGRRKSKMGDGSLIPGQQATDGGTGKSRSLVSRKHVAVESPEWWINKLLPCPGSVSSRTRGHYGRHATVSSQRCLGIVWRRELLSAKQEMRLIIRIRRGRVHGE